MENANLLLSFTPVPFLSLLIWVMLVLAALYLARKPFHRCMAAIGLLIYHALRLASYSVKKAEQRLQIRNREVLLSAGLDAAERKVEREFERITGSAQRDLQGYPIIQRRLSETLLQLEDDFHKSAEIPQNLPDWVKVMDAVANIKPSGDRMVVNMLEQIHETIGEQYKTAAEQYRRSVAVRHNLLSRMMPIWRQVHKTLAGVETTITHLGQRSDKIDQYMDDYHKILAQQDSAVRRLSSSSLTQFFISGLMLAVAFVGAIINFNLVALPMSEMVGGSNYIGNFRTADVAGMFIVCLEIVVGVFLMDSLRITRLFSIIGSMEDNKRRIIFWILLGMLTILALVESSLSYMRDQIAADMEALRQSLSGVEISAVANSRIPTYGQMVMGFILPFILTFVAIPFETFISSGRTVLGVLCALSLRVIAFILRLSAGFGFYLGRLLVNVYDLIIFLPLWIDNLAVQHLFKKKPAAGNKGKGSIKERDLAQVGVREG